VPGEIQEQAHQHGARSHGQANPTVPHRAKGIGDKNHDHAGKLGHDDGHQEQEREQDDLPPSRSGRPIRFTSR